MASDGILHPSVDDQGRPVATLYVEPGAILESGMWCDDCLTSAIICVEILALGVDGFRRIAVARWCDHCKQLKQDPL